jgi:ribose/xylose/arabinose/galactoside ABC-type transport system permease subunit
MTTETTPDRRSTQQPATDPAPAAAPRGPVGEWWHAAVRHRLFWPVVALVLLLVLNVAFTHNFFSIRLQQGHLYGSLISILLFGAPLILVALGMTLVIATGGIDLSVGAVVAISGALACLYVSKETDQNSATGVLVAVVLSLGLGLVLGLWNGVLVARIGVQPIVATLILMVAGRGVAQLITSGQIITINSSSYGRIGGGYLLTLPISIFIVAGVVALTVALTRRTALGLMVESVGGNAEASRLVGINARRIKVMVYMFCALCAAIAGIIISSNVSSADGNNAGLWIELDAILAVVIGGTSLTGGRFSIGGTVVGALIIQTLTTTIYTIGVPTQSTLVFKAVVVICVCLMQSPAFRQKVFTRRRRRPDRPAPQVPRADVAARAEVQA